MQIRIDRSNALFGFISAIVGAGTTIVLTVAFLSTQWGEWVEIRDAHRDGKVINGVTTDALDLSPFVRKEALPDFDSFAEKGDIPSLLGYARETQLPDLSTYAKLSDIPSAPDLSDVVRYGHEVKLRYASNSSNKFLDSVNFDAVTGDSTGLWAIER